MDLLAHEWTILHRRDWGHEHDSLIPEGAPVPEPDDDLAVVKVVDAERLRGAVKALEYVREALSPRATQSANAQRAYDQAVFALNHLGGSDEIHRRSASR